MPPVALAVHVIAVPVGLGGMGLGVSAVIVGTALEVMLKNPEPAQASYPLAEPLFLTQTWTAYWPACVAVQDQVLLVE